LPAPLTRFNAKFIQKSKTRYDNIFLLFYALNPHEYHNQKY